MDTSIRHDIFNFWQSHNLCQHFLFATSGVVRPFASDFCHEMRPFHRDIWIRLHSLVKEDKKQKLESSQRPDKLKNIAVEAHKGASIHFHQGNANLKSYLLAGDENIMVKRRPVKELRCLCVHQIPTLVSNHIRRVVNQSNAASKWFGLMSGINLQEEINSDDIVDKQIQALSQYIFSQVTW